MKCLKNLEALNCGWSYAYQEMLHCLLHKKSIKVKMCWEAGDDQWTLVTVSWLKVFPLFYFPILTADLTTTDPCCHSELLLKYQLEKLEICVGRHVTTDNVEQIFLSQFCVLSPASIIREIAPNRISVATREWSLKPRPPAQDAG